MLSSFLMQSGHGDQPPRTKYRKSGFRQGSGLPETSYKTWKTEYRRTAPLRLQSSRCIEFLGGEKLVRPFLVAYSFVSIIGATINLGLLWDIADTFNGLMAIPNLIALLILSGQVKKLAIDVDQAEKSGTL